jgi:hypothetical protein
MVARCKRVVPPRSRRASGYTAGEMRQTVDALRAWRAAHPGIDNPGPDDGWHGNVRGVEAFVDQDVRLRAKLARSHPSRLKVLDQVENLPFDLHHEVIGLALSEPNALLSATSDQFDIGVSGGEPDRAAIIAELMGTLRTLRVLVLLGSSSGLCFPAVSLLTLLWALSIIQAQYTAPHVLPSVAPPRVVRPPGQFVIAGPRAPRAPGRPHPSLSITVEGASGYTRQRGAP